MKRHSGKALLLVLLAALALAAQPRPEAGLPAPVLRPGEGLAMAFDADVRAYGEARSESSLGGLAKLVWLRMEGADWSSQSVIFRCAGAAGCGGPKGHGRVSLARALQEECDQAFLAWIDESRKRWLQDYTEAPARIRLEEVFAPFLGRRLPRGEGLPAFTAAWVGDGDLLRASPLSFLLWLLEPDKAEVLTFGKRHLSGFWVEVKDLLGREDWWFKTATAPGPAASTTAWVVGGRGSVVVVFRMPDGKGRPEGLARLRQLLGLGA